MKNAISTLRIQNFKSIKDVEMKPRRVNIIIGAPNVGKSNILEAMSLLGGMVYEQTERFMGSFIRYEEPRQLFYDNLIRNTIKIETNNEIALVGRYPSDATFRALFLSNYTYSEIKLNATFHRKYETFMLGEEDTFLNEFDDLISQVDSNKPGESRYMYIRFDSNGNFKLSQYQDRLRVNTRYYNFRKNAFSSKDQLYDYLSPPCGANLISVVQDFPSLREDIAKLFKPYGLKVQLRVDDQRLEVVKDLDGFIYSYPYSSTADTLQRLIFYLAAIESNDDAVILLEEPEAHSYPLYVAQLGRRIVESRNNQFFVATHSPYLITEILEEMLTDDELKPELAMFVAYYEDYQTKVRQLTDEEVMAIRADGLDVFYNMARFVPEPGE